MMFLAAAFPLVHSRSAQAAPIVCQRAQAGSILADGVTSDWKGVGQTVLDSRSAIIPGGLGSWSGRSDLSVRVLCQYTSSHLYLLIRVRDEYVVRLHKADLKQDHVALCFLDGGIAKTLVLFPSDGQNRSVWGWLPPSGRHRRHRRRHRLRLRRARGMDAAIFRLADGYGIELSMANQAVPSYGSDSAALRVSVVVSDADSKTHLVPQTVMGTGTQTSLGRIVFEEAAVLLKRFLASRGLRTSQIVFNKIDNFVTGPSLERAIIADRYLAVMGGDITGGGWFFLTLPVRTASDILRFAARDMDGDGQPEILVRLRQAVAGRIREVFLIYRYQDTGGIGLIFGQVIVHRGPGGKILTNRYRYIRTKQGYDMEFRVDRCKGFTAQNHPDVEAKDIQTILTPWGEHKSVRYHFTQDGYQEVTR